MQAKYSAFILCVVIQLFSCTRSGFIIAYDTGLLNKMLPGGLIGPGAYAQNNLAKVASGSKAFSPKFGSSSNGAKSVGTNSQKALPEGAKTLALPAARLNNSWIRFLQVNKGKYKGQGLGKNWINQAAKDYHRLKAEGRWQ